MHKTTLLIIIIIISSCHQPSQNVEQENENENLSIIEKDTFFKTYWYNMSSSEFNTIYSEKNLDTLYWSGNAIPIITKPVIEKDSLKKIELFIENVSEVVDPTKQKPAIMKERDKSGLCFNCPTIYYIPIEHLHAILKLYETKFGSPLEVKDNDVITELNFNNKQGIYNFIQNQTLKREQYIWNLENKRIIIEVISRLSINSLKNCPAKYKLKTVKIIYIPIEEVKKNEAEEKREKVEELQRTEKNREDTKTNEQVTINNI